MKLNKILFPTDFSRCANQALARTVLLAKSYGAELHMLHAIVLHDEDPHNPAFHLPDIEEIHTKLRETASEKMTSVIKSYDAMEMKVVKVQERGIAPAPVIMAYAKRNNIDLIIMGTHGRRGLGHLLLGSVAEEVVRMGPCPVLTIREQKEPAPISDRMSKILVPVDFSEHAKSALSHAKALADAHGAELQILHVIEESLHPSYYIAGMSSIFDLEPDIKPKSETAMRKLFSETDGPQVTASYHLVEGQAAPEISNFAREQNSDMIVISTHGLTGIEHLLVGSITERVIRLANCPVFTVKAFGRSLVR
jgi:nucleotide-binding universal stress UspA family protein